MFHVEQFAYLKYNYSTPFFCALLNGYMDKSDRLLQIYREAQRYDIKFNKANVNISDELNKVVNGTIYKGLLSIKGIGRRACEGILEERKVNGIYDSIEDFRMRIPPKSLNCLAMQILINEGAF